MIRNIVRNSRAIVISAALAMPAASYAMAQDIPALYKEASAPWSAELAVKLPPLLTPEILAAIGKNYGAPAAKKLAVKKEKVSALADHFKACSLTVEDLKTAKKYLDKKFGAEINYFASYGCKTVKETMAGLNTAAPAQSASLGRLEEFSAYRGDSASAARFFDGSRNRGKAREPVTIGAAEPPDALDLRAPVKTRLTAAVPSLDPKTEVSKPVSAPMPDINKYGPVHQAVNYWADMREKGWRTYKNGGLSDPKTAKGLAKAAIGGGFEKLLTYSNLPRVELAAAQLGWDSGGNAPRMTIVADTLKLTFHSAVAFLLLCPLPITRTAQAAWSGDATAQLLARRIGGTAFNRLVLYTVKKLPIKKIISKNDE